MKYILGTITTLLIILSFTNRKCDHVFTEVVQPLVKVDYSDRWVNAVYTIGPTGRHEGNELICVKCFHKQKQIVDYGPALPLLNGAISFIGDTTIDMGNIHSIREIFKIDSTGMIIINK